MRYGSSRRLGASIVRKGQASVVLSALAVALWLPVGAEEVRDPDLRVDVPNGLLSTAVVYGTSIDIVGSEIHTSYIRKRFFFGHDPFYNVSINGGGTWRTADVRLNTQFMPGSFEGDTKDTLVRTGGDNFVHVVMVSRTTVRPEAFVTSSSDRGLTWADPIDATTFSEDMFAFDYRMVATPGGRASLVWYDESNGNSGLGFVSVWITSTTDGGATWLPKQRLNFPDEGPQPELLERSSEVDVCDAAGRIYTAWTDRRDPTNQSNNSEVPGRIVLRYSTDGGATFLPSSLETRLDVGDAVQTESSLPRLACLDDQTVVAVWQDERSGDNDIYMNISTDGGVNWLAADRRVDTSSPASTNATAPRVVLASDGTIYVSWLDDRDGGNDLYFAKSVDDGVTFSVAQRLNDGVAAGNYPIGDWDMDADSSTVSVAWADNRSGPISPEANDVFLKRSLDGGDTFLPEQRIDLGSPAGAAESREVVLAASTEASIAIWADFRDDIDNGDIFGGGVGPTFDAQNPDGDSRIADDNCPNYPNDSQIDSDFDQRGDACDPYPMDVLNDIDGDGFPVPMDNCPRRNNVIQEDLDNDGFGEECDLCPQFIDIDQRDLDGDGVGDPCDGDIDGDGQDNGVDGDDDNDGIGDGTDNCVNVRNSAQLDDDNDGEGDACDNDDLITQQLTVRPSAQREIELIEWEFEPRADSYNVYFGLASQLGISDGFCFAPNMKENVAWARVSPPVGEAFWFLSTGVELAVEGSPGRRSDGTPRNVPNPCDVTAARDWDADGVLNIDDNCAFAANSGQEDADGDLVGDLCDLFPQDPFNDSLDGDGVGGSDNCPLIANADQADADSDGRGDLCDICPNAADPLQLDSDKDGIGDACDDDQDGDGTPDASDPDIDGDGILNAADNCSDVGNDTQADQDSDGTGDACDFDDQEVRGLRFALGSTTQLEWAEETGAATYNVYADRVDNLSLGGNYGQCFANGSPFALEFIEEVPPAGEADWYLVTGVFTGVEGTAGFDSQGTERQVPGCP